MVGNDIIIDQYISLCLYDIPMSWIWVLWLLLFTDSRPIFNLSNYNQLNKKYLQIDKLYCLYQQSNYQGKINLW